MGRKFHAAAGLSYEFDPGSAAAFMAGVIEMGTVFILKDGFIAGVPAPAPSNNSWRVMHEIFWWSPEGGGELLRQALEEEARATGCQEIEFSYPEEKRVVGRLLLRKGYAPKTAIVTRRI